MLKSSKEYKNNPIAIIMKILMYFTEGKNRGFFTDELVSLGSLLFAVLPSNSNKEIIPISTAKVIWKIIQLYNPKSANGVSINGITINNKIPNEYPDKVRTIFRLKLRELDEESMIFPSITTSIKDKKMRTPKVKAKAETICL